MSNKQPGIFDLFRNSRTAEPPADLCAQDAPTACTPGPPPRRRPKLLVSYVYLDAFLKRQSEYVYEDWVLDSGAFSAHNKGEEIDLATYIDCIHKLQDSDKTLTEVFALDVIGDWRGSLRNCEKMWDKGIEAIPCYHPGRNEPEDVLVGLARDYPKIAVGGVVGVTKHLKERIIGQVFNRAWPCKIHGFGMSSADMVMKYPFHSVDASNWEVGPCAFGNWAAFGNMSIRGKDQDLRAEVEWHMDLQARAREKWAPLWSKVGLSAGPDVRLATVGNDRCVRNLSG